MYRLSDRILCYMYLMERGACDRALVVFEDIPIIRRSDVEFLVMPEFIPYDTIVWNLWQHVRLDSLIDALLDAILCLADDYSWDSGNTEYCNRWRQMRYANPHSSPSFPSDDDLPF